MNRRRFISYPPTNQHHTNEHVQVNRLLQSPLISNENAIRTSNEAAKLHNTAVNEADSLNVVDYNKMNIKNHHHMNSSINTATANNNNSQVFQKESVSGFTKQEQKTSSTEHSFIQRQSMARVFRNLFPFMGDMNLASKVSRLTVCTDKASKQKSEEQKKEYAHNQKKKYEWLFETMSRSQADEIMSDKPVGTFLIRASEHYPGDYTLSLKSNVGIEHYRIVTKQNTYTIDGEVIFRDLLKLVQHYEKDADGLCCSLTTPAGVCMSRSEEAIENDNYNEILTFDKNASCFVDQKSITISNILGEGEYARVYKGEVEGLVVAVKVIKDTIHLPSFTREATIMRTLNHPHLLSTYGISLIADKKLPDLGNNIVGRSACILMEYMSIGNLHEYLMSRGRTLVNTHTLMTFIRNICEALVYLEKKCIAHCDIAANNVLLNHELIPKLSDFGLAIKYGDSIPAKLTKSADHREKIRIKWAAPESLKNNIHNNKSDMWSFGVLMWEIFQFGRTPYPRIRNSQMLEYIAKGNRMEPPENCSTHVAQLMTKCWNFEPRERPTFVDALSALLVCSNENEL